MIINLNTTPIFTDAEYLDAAKACTAQHDRSKPVTEHYMRCVMPVHSILSTANEFFTDLTESLYLVQAGFSLVQAKTLEEVRTILAECDAHEEQAVVEVHVVNGRHLYSHVPISRL